MENPNHCEFAQLRDFLIRYGYDNDDPDDDDDKEDEPDDEDDRFAVILKGDILHHQV